ncbi:MAG: Crp/Fnr family transcriptional regulator [Dehalococcoidales bacterium]|nr:Crp/Fnr family transcriptional regulator [Dehalococcoidales bacterium]
MKVNTIELNTLKSIAYFSGLSPAELEAVKRLVFEKAVAKGEIVVFEGEPARELYFAVSGVVRTFKISADGKEQVIALVRPFESFNDIPVFGAGVNLTSALAMSNIILYGIKKSDMETVLRNNPKVAQNTIGVLSQRIEHLTLLVEDLSFRHVTSRVAKILLEYAADGTGQKARLTQQDMAAMAGTAREMVGRSLKTLEAEGTIKLAHHRVIVTDLRALRQVAGVN